jgi:hypothetical protein
MGKQNRSKASSGTRTRVNPITGATETLPGTKAGKKRTRAAFNDPLRTHITYDKKASKHSK